MHRSRRRRWRRWILGAGAAACLGAALPAWVLLSGWLRFRRLETSVVDKMDQYWLAVAVPGREEYLLSGDEIFEVPYMASTLSVAAEPTRVLDREGRLIAEFAAERGLYARRDEDLPPFLKRAIVAAEDGDFFAHRGVDPAGIARAALRNLAAGRVVQGGSTLTQQLAKILFTARERTLDRKVFEMFCALRLERKFTKEQLLLMYLNYVYFGHGCFGVECAARFYFDKPAAALELPEAALLAGLIASPNNYSPFRSPELARARQRTVLRRMAKEGFLADSAVERVARDFWKRMETRLEAPEASIWRTTLNRAPYLTEAVRRDLAARFPVERVLKGGLRVRTTFDLELQRAAKEALEAGLEEEQQAYRRRLAKERARRGGSAPESSTDTARVEGALAAVRPQDGALLALVGGSGFRFGNQFDRALGGARPIGSAIKPFVFAAAFENGGLRPEDLMVDERRRYRSGAGRSWSPRNYGGKYYGEVTLRVALQKSLNTVTVELLRKAGTGAAVRLLTAASGAPRERFPRNLTLALGSAGMTPVELAGSYALLANGGRPVRPYFIAAIEDREGRPLYARAEEALEPALSSGTCLALRETLVGVLGPGGTAYGAARRTGFTLAAAGKTGTTDDYRDAWFAGWTPELAAAVRVGFDDMRPLGPGRTGGAAAAPVWLRFVKAAYRDKPAPAWPAAAPLQILKSPQ